MRVLASQTIRVAFLGQGKFAWPLSTAARVFFDVRPHSGESLDCLHASVSVAMLLVQRPHIVGLPYTVA
jgi:hypothetical protein